LDLPKATTQPAAGWNTENGTATERDFSKLAIASWGGMELTVDPFSGATAGLTNMVLNAYMDVNLLQPKAFAVCKDIDA
jgi:hypothetical protein